MGTGQIPGTLTSPEFKIKTKAYLSFLIGGGDYEHDTFIRLNLLIHGKVVAQCDRLAKRPLGSRQLGCEPIFRPDGASANR